MNAQLALDIQVKKTDFCLTVKHTLATEGITGVIGHSGSGKTTLLRAIAGLEATCQGNILFKNQQWQTAQRTIATHQRPIGYVFQEANLFNHLSALDNLRFALKRAKGQPLTSLNEIIALLGIEPIIKRLPSQLSGGEKQRVAIARALLINPELLLMDEPLSSLDSARKQEILPYLETIKNTVKVPIIYVTHAIDEVTRLADNLIILEKGQVVGAGQLSETLSHLDFAYDFGDETSSVVQGKISGRDPQWQMAKITLDGQDLWFSDKSLKGANNKTTLTIRLRVLARDVSLATIKPEQTSIQNSVRATIVKIKKDDSHSTLLVKLQLGGQAIVARISQRAGYELGLAIGQTVWAQIKSVAIAG